MKKIDLTGRRFGKLKAVSLIGGRKWLFICDCGKEHAADRGNVVSGKSNSCGCVINRTKKSEMHGATDTDEYRIYRSMIARCYNENAINYDIYGGRGITVCDEWRASYGSFLAHVGPRPSKQHSIDRIENDLGYEPGNVCWSTKQDQANNRRNNKLITFNGVTQTTAQWARQTGINRTTIDARIEDGWPVERIFEPVRIRK